MTPSATLQSLSRPGVGISHLEMGSISRILYRRRREEMHGVVKTAMTLQHRLLRLDAASAESPRQERPVEWHTLLT